MVRFYVTEGTQIPFLERETSYPEGSTFRIDDDISQTLRPLKCKRNVSISVYILCFPHICT